jgi:protocatechuate 3,4-dioxygenase, alpha subunit
MKTVSLRIAGVESSASDSRIFDDALAERLAGEPGSVPDPHGKPQAPHLLLAVFARGMLRHLYTRIYFGDEAGNASDPALVPVPADRRVTLIAARAPANGNAAYQLDLRLQGDGETVFFEV